MSANLLITGPPRVGKTTALARLVELLPPEGLAGFLTREVRRDGARVGFRLTGFDGSEELLAHHDLCSCYRLGRYAVDVDALNRIVGRCLFDQAERFVVDEIGKMECFSPRFIDRMTVLLDDPRPVVASVALRGRGFVARVKQRPDVEVWELTAANRDALPRQLLTWLRGARGPSDAS